MKKRYKKNRVWLAPCWLAAISIGGLVSALIADHIWDYLSWIMLATPAVIAILKLLPERENSFRRQQ